MAAVIVPWRPGDVHREAAWSLLKQQHLDAGRTVIEGTCDGDWCKAAAVADAISRTDDNILVLHDADVWTDGLDVAIEAVDSTTRWAVPHLKVWRLTEGQQEPTTDRSGLAQPPYPGWLGGGVVVVDRAAYENCPMDARFVGWGQEDSSFALALGTLYGLPWRGVADLWHWWHPPQTRLNRSVGSRASEALHRRYKRATASRIDMLALVEEAKSWQSTSSSTGQASVSS